MMPADFGQEFLTFSLVRQRVFVRAPEIFDHLALRNERAFGFQIPVAASN